MGHLPPPPPRTVPPPGPHWEIGQDAGSWGVWFVGPAGARVLLVGGLSSERVAGQWIIDYYQGLARAENDKLAAMLRSVPNKPPS